ncbi:MAG: hypothetical protein K8H88_21615 [Sandaracinaceae bacterium]|nr:hypothetical protein [Sandaracinaceae bacterium]
MQDGARYAKITARTSCGECGQPVPLTSLTEQAVCPYCHASNEIPREIWEQIVVEADEASDDGSSTEGSQLEGAREVFYTITCGKPRCEACHKPLAVGALAIGESRNFTCTECGDPASTEPVPDWVGVGPAKQLYSVEPKGSLAGHEALAMPEKAARPIAMSCPRCGGGLEITASSERLLACRFCNADVYLPDPIWRRLHPVKRVMPFYLRFEGPSRARRKRDREALRAERDARLAAQRQEEQERNRQINLRAEAEAQAQWASRVRAATRAAWWPAIALTIYLATLATVSWLTLGRSPGWVAPAAGIVLVVAVLVTTLFVSRPIQLASGNPFEWILFVTWFWIPFALLMPIAGQIMALVRVVILMRGKFGAATIKSNGSSTSYDRVELGGGESRPAALMFLALGVLWPLTILPFLAPEMATDVLGRLVN